LPGVACDPRMLDLHPAIAALGQQLGYWRGG
jgi:hypothetical protein